MMVPAPVGFAGLGSLGGPMAERLVGAGIELRVWDLDALRVQALVDLGATAADGPDDLAACEALLLVVPDDAAVSGLLAGEDGLLAQLPPGGVVVVHSTLLPATVTTLAAEADSRRIALLDAPVSGGPERAAAGDLTVMVGGNDDAVAAARPLLERLASEVHHVGGSGAGAAVKLANQAMLFSALAGVYEGLELAAAYGVDEAAALDVVSSSLGESWVTRNWGFFDDMVRTYDAMGTPPEQRSWRKDLRDVVATAEDRGLDLPVSRLLAETLATRVEGRAAEQP
jgi:3-hydroxyisobutyrate dehydrogenase-like beta-hydroxyacid dehydrogenase